MSLLLPSQQDSPGPDPPPGEFLRSVRASLSGVAIHCPQAIRLAQEAAQRRSGAAEQGTRLHEAVARIVRGERIDFGEFEPEDRSLLAAASAIWNTLAEWHPNPMIEEQREADGVTGRIDLSSWQDRETFNVVDWKFGRIEGEAAVEQTKTYLGFGAEANPEAFRFHGTVVYPRLRFWKSFSFGRAAILEHMTRLRTNLAEARTPKARFVRGDHCEFCPAVGLCPAIKRDIAVIDWRSPISALDLGEMEPREILRLKGLRDIVNRFIEQFDEAYRARVALAPIPIEETGEEIALLPAKRQEVLVNDTTRETLRAWGLTPEQIDLATTISLTDIGLAASANAPRGMKGKAKDGIGAALEEAGCIAVHEFERLGKRPIAALQQIESEDTERSDTNEQGPEEG